MSTTKFENLQQNIIECRQCKRLVSWCQQVAKEKRASFKDETYWGKPLPSFGTEDAQVLVVGLAPAAHGANRTGRMFTGDRSGEWLYRALHRAGLANQAESTGQGDGLRLNNAVISAVVRCAPPDNKPTTDERNQCLPYLVEEIQALNHLKVIVCLGGFAHEGVLMALKSLGLKKTPKEKFSHGQQYKLGPYLIICSYHPSQQNTFTKRLTEPMFDGIFRDVNKRIKK